MPTVAVPRADLATEEVVTVPRNGLGAGYNVLPGMAIGRMAFQGPRKAGRTRSWSAPATNQIVKAGNDHPTRRAHGAVDQPRRDHLDPGPQHLRRRLQNPRGAGELAEPVSALGGAAGRRVILVDHGWSPAR